MNLYLAIIALCALLRARILGVYPCTTLPGSAVRNALSGLAMGRPVGYQVTRHDDWMPARTRSDALWGTCRRLGRWVWGRQDTGSEWLRIGTENLGKSIDTWPVSMIDWRVGHFLQKPKTDISGMSDLSPYIRIYHDISDLSSFMFRNGQIPHVGYFMMFQPMFRMFRDSRHLPQLGIYYHLS